MSSAGCRRSVASTPSKALSQNRGLHVWRRALSEQVFPLHHVVQQFHYASHVESFTSRLVAFEVRQRPARQPPGRGQLILLELEEHGRGLDQPFVEIPPVVLRRPPQ